MDQHAAIDLYLGDLARRGRRPTTLNSYRRLLNNLAALAPGRDTHELDLADYERFLNRWTAAEPSTLASGVSLAKGYSRFLYERGLSDRDVAYQLQRPKRRRPEDLAVVRVTPQDVASLFAHCRPLHDRHADPAAAKWQELLCVATAVYLGARRAALARVRRGDVDLVAGTIRFLEKGGKVVTKPLPDEYQALLVAAERDGLWQSADDYLIPSRRRRAVRNPERSDKVVWQTVKAVAVRAGVRVHVHALRAAFADMFDEQHPDQAIALKELMGHSRLETTLVYLSRRRKQQKMELVRDLSWGLSEREPRQDALERPVRGGADAAPAGIPAARSESPTGVFESQTPDVAPSHEEAHTGFEPVFQESPVSIADTENTKGFGSIADELAIRRRELHRRRNR